MPVDLSPIVRPTSWKEIVGPYTSHGIYMPPQYKIQKQNGTLKGGVGKGKKIEEYPTLILISSGKLSRPSG